MMTSGGRSSSRYPFTASQWQELEQQALIFKYMASGHPIPSDLILHIRRSFLLDSITTTSPTLPFAPHPTLGWSCYQMGFGRKAEDPEPGRCRRTDGKKWRCSKEAYPDSKYCERHMHRGKNRSRKPVEMSNLTTTPAAVVPSSSQPPPPAPLSLSTQPETYHLMYPYPSYSSSRTTGSVGLHPLQHNTTHFTPYSSADKNYRYCHGVKDADEYTFFSEGSGAERGSLLCLGEPKQSHALQQGSYNFTTELSKEVGEKQQQQQQHCFVLGADFKLEKPMKEEREEEAQRPLRHFFDEWPQKSRESWMDLEEGGRTNPGSYSKTQLSISIPMAHHDFMVSGSRYRNDD